MSPLDGWEELCHKLCGASHKGLCPTGEKRLARNRGGRQQDHASAPIGQPDQQKEGNKDARKSQHQTPSNKMSRSSPERRPRSFAWCSRKACAERRPSSRSRQKKSHSAISLEEALNFVRISFGT